MPNHVHLPGYSSRGFAEANEIIEGHHRQRANNILAMTGSCFWQEESYDHRVRTAAEFQKIHTYI
jgi:hypothetical protein